MQNLLIFLLITLVTSKSCNADMPEIDYVLKKDHIPEVTTHTFDAALNTTDYLVLTLYSPTCPHCVALHPEFRKTSLLFEDIPGVSFARVDCQDKFNSLVCLALDVAYYPTILILSRNNLRHIQSMEDAARQDPLVTVFGWDVVGKNAVEYRGDKDHTTLAQWIRRRLIFEMPELVTFEQVGQFQSQHNVSLTFFNASCSDQLPSQIFREYALYTINQIIRTTTHQVGSGFVSELSGLPCTFLLSTSQGGTHQFAGWWSLGAIERHMQQNMFPGIVELTQDLWAKIESFTEVTKILMLIKDPTILRAFKQLQRSSSTKYVFCYAEGALAQTIADEQMISEFHQNLFLLIDETLISYELTEEELTLESMSTFVKDFAEGNFASEEIVQL